MTDKREKSMEVDEENVVELINEEGGIERFVFEMTVEYEGKTYALMSSETNEEEAAFFEMIGKGEEITLRLIVDDELLEKLYALYLESVEEE